MACKLGWMLALGIHRLGVSFLISRPFVDIKPVSVHLWQPLFLRTTFVNDLVCQCPLQAKITLTLWYQML